MKRAFIFYFTVVFSVCSYAINKQYIADTLTHIVHQHAFAGNVCVSDIRVNNQYVSVYTNATLSHASFTPKEVRDIRILISNLVLGHSNGKVSIYSGDMELNDLITSLHKARPASARYTLNNVSAWVRNISAPYSITGGLSGKHIALWGSHGRYYNQTTEQWIWQRAKLWTTVEDVYTSSYTMPFLVPMLENAGAVVVQPRERDTQTTEQVIDDLAATTHMVLGGIEEPNTFDTIPTGGWGKDSDDVLTEKENPFEMGGYMSAKVSSKNIIELHYTPTSLPYGEYAVYVSYKTLPNSTSAAKYTVVHCGEKTEFEVNQQMGGGTWVYLGTFAFDSNPENNYVSVSNTGKGKAVVTSDAIKFGGGVGNVARYPQPNKIENTPSSQSITISETEVDSAQLLANQAWAMTSGMPRYLEAARYWLQYAGIPDSIYNYTDSRNDYTDDYCARGQWVNYLAGGSQANPKQEGLGVPLHLSLAFHSDAGVKRGDTIIGTLMIYTDFDNDKAKVYPTGCSRQVARDLGDYMQTQIVEDVRALYTPHWQRRQLQNSSYAEARHPKVPGVLLELLSHQNYNDMRYGLDPRVRFTVSRAIYKSMLKFIHAQYGTEYVVQPLPVNSMVMKRLDKEALMVTWKETEDHLESTAKPTYYIVYTRKNDGDWDNGVRVRENQYRINAEKGVRYDIKVVAGNAGGVSMPSEIVSAYIAPEEKGRILVLNAFTRVSGPDWFEDSTFVGIKPQSHGVGYGKDISFIGEQFDFDSRHPWITDDECGWGSCYCDQQASLTMGNTFDYSVMHGRVLAAMGYSYISANAYAVDTIQDCDAVDLIMGKQKTTILGNDTAFKTFTPALQSVLSKYLQAGGNMLISGSYIASDMQDNVEKNFVRDYLHYTYRCDHASKQGGVIVNRRVLTPGWYTFRTSPNAKRIHTENPECILPTDGARAVAHYEDTKLNAAVAYDGTEEDKGKTLSWAFMLESTDDFNTLYKESIDWLMR